MGGGIGNQKKKNLEQFGHVLNENKPPGRRKRGSHESKKNEAMAYDRKVWRL